MGRILDRIFNAFGGYNGIILTISLVWITNLLLSFLSGELSRIQFGVMPSSPGLLIASRVFLFVYVYLLVIPLLTVLTLAFFKPIVVSATCGERI